MTFALSMSPTTVRMAEAIPPNFEMLRTRLLGSVQLRFQGLFQNFENQVIQGKNQVIPHAARSHGESAPVDLRLARQDPDSPRLPRLFPR